MTAILSPSHSSNDDISTLLTNQQQVQEEQEVLQQVEEREKRDKEEEDISVLALVVTLLRKSLLAGCRADGDEELRRSMEISWPTDVQHVAHVTFDRFHGFLGLPVEFEPEVPRRAPSASANVFGVSTESMQCSYDSRGNSIPTILLLMQRRLYEQGGLQAEGIFRINAENSQEEYVRDQLNSGIVPDGVDVHCLAGLIKAWFRELPTGVLDPLTSEQVMQCQSEEECAQVVKLLPPTETALLDWAINLMADVVQEEHRNKMNARNVAMVFAPNMTQMADPLTALMYAVQVMNFLKMLIEKNLKERKESTLEDISIPHSDPPDENGHQYRQLPPDASSKEAIDQDFITKKPILDDPAQLPQENPAMDEATGDTTQTSHENAVSEETTTSCTNNYRCEQENAVNSSMTVHVNSWRTRKGKFTKKNHKKGMRKASGPSPVRAVLEADKSKGTSIVSRINSKVERVEAWR